MNNENAPTAPKDTAANVHRERTTIERIRARRYHADETPYPTLRP